MCFAAPAKGQVIAQAAARGACFKEKAFAEGADDIVTRLENWLALDR
jgi:hypothetical protein